MTRGYVSPRFCTYVQSAKPNPHEFVMLGREGLVSAKFYCENSRERSEKDSFKRQLQECSVVVKISDNSEFSRSNREFYTRLRLQLRGNGSR